MKNKPLCIINMTQGHAFKWGWVRFRDFKVRFNESLAKRASEALKKDK